MPHVSMAQFDDKGIKSASLTRVVGEDDANGVVYDTICLLAGGAEDDIAELFTAWLESLRSGCVCENDCPPGILFDVMDGTSIQMSYYTNLDDGIAGLF